MCIIGSSWKEDSNNDDIGPIVPSSWKEDINTSKTEYIILDSKEDLFKAYKKLSFKDKRWLEIKISGEKINRVNLNKKKC